ncbi:hypothetical protein HYV50_01250 [Candidatus Pacearchaeota archaeon]|nr:hypothetical protein [Candidatus Pacearchaeota archaeon]
MQLKEIFNLIEEKRDSRYIMDRCLMWFLYRYKVLKWDIEDYYEMPSVFESNTHGEIQRMLKELKELSIGTHFGNLVIELNSEVMHIMMATLPGGEKFRVKNQQEDLALRDKLMKEVEKDKAEFESKKMERDIIKKLKEENHLLKERIAVLERYFLVY